MASIRYLTAWIMMACLMAAAPLGRAQTTPPESPPDPAADLAQRLERLQIQLSDRIQALEQAVKLLQERLGESFGRPSPFHTIEKRLEDIEKRLEEMERDLRDMERDVSRVARDR